jgi:hypothetical protein
MEESEKIVKVQGTRHKGQGSRKRPRDKAQERGKKQASGKSQISNSPPE